MAYLSVIIFVLRFFGVEYSKRHSTKNKIWHSDIIVSFGAMNPG